MEAQAVVHRFRTRVEDVQRHVDRYLRWHFRSSGQLAAEVLAGLEAAIGDEVAVEVGEAQFQQRERLREAGAIVDDRVDHQRAAEFGMAADHQVAAPDLLHVDLGGKGAADFRAELGEPGAIGVLARQFVEMVGDVLSGETAQRQQDQQQPAETPRPLAPGLLPGQLQRLVAQLVETLDRRLVLFAGAAQGRDGLFLGAFLVVFIQGAQAVAALAEAGLVVIVVIENEAKFRRILGAAQRHEGYPLFRQRFAEARFLARVAARRLGRFGIGDQRLGPAFVVWIAFVVAARQQALRRSRGLLDAGELLVQLEFVELGQFLVEVEAVQVEVVMDPQGFVARARCRGRGRGGGRDAWRGWRSGDRLRFGCRRSVRARRATDLVLQGVEDFQAGAAADRAIGGAQLRVVDAETGAAMGTLGDDAFAHAAIRRENPAASLPQASCTKAVGRDQWWLAARHQSARRRPLMRIQPSRSAVGSRSKCAE